MAETFSPVQLGGGYGAVPYESILLDGSFASDKVLSIYIGRWSIIGPDNRVVLIETGKVFYTHSSIAKCREALKTSNRI